METIMKLAHEGGYGYPNGSKTTHRLMKTDTMNPLFWQALGKSCGWEETRWKDAISDKTLLRRYERKGGLYHALTFHEINLTENWDKAVAYLLSITSK